MYTSIEDLREQYEFSETLYKFGINFNEYAVLFRLREGAKLSHIYESLYLSEKTIYRCKKSLIKKLKTRSFEEALIKAGEGLFLKKQIKSIL